MEMNPGVRIAGKLIASFLFGRCDGVYMDGMASLAPPDQMVETLQQFAYKELFSNPRTSWERKSPFSGEEHFTYWGTKIINLSKKMAADCGAH